MLRSNLIMLYNRKKGLDVDNTDFLSDRPTQASVRMLADETLLQIFHLCVEPRFSKAFSAIWLSSVCRLWCSMLRSSPNWWTDIRFSIDDPVSMAYAKEFMDRAGNMPLKVRMKGLGSAPQAEAIARFVAEACSLSLSLSMDLPSL